MCLYLWGRWGREKTESTPKLSSVGKVLEMKCCDSVVLGLCTEAMLPECLVLFLVHWAWWYQQDLPGRQGKRLGKHYSKGLWAHPVTETWQNRPKIRDISSGLLAPLSSFSLQKFPERKIPQPSANQHSSPWLISVPMKQIVLESSFCFPPPLTFLASPAVTCTLTETFPLLPCFYALIKLFNLIFFFFPHFLGLEIFSLHLYWREK